MSKFKGGPTKTRDGRDAIIHAVDGPRISYPIVCSYKSGPLSDHWNEQSVDKNGYFNLEVGDCFNDLLPNVEPEKYEFECEWTSYNGCPAIHPKFLGKAKEAFIGKRTKVTVMVIE